MVQGGKRVESCNPQDRVAKPGVDDRNGCAQIV